MAKTRHMDQRMNQRGIKSALLDIVVRLGEWNGDKCYLNKKGCADALRALDEVRKNLLDIHKKGGIVLVENAGFDITCYRLESFKRRK